MLTAAVVLCVATAVCSLHLPPYIKPCPRNKPDFKECALKHAHGALPSLFKGDRKYHIPNMDPLLVDELTVGTNAGPIDIVINMKDIKIWGMPQSVIEDFDVDFENHVISYDVLFSRLEIESFYNMSGKFLILPINGLGKCNMTFVGFRNKVLIDYNLIKKDNGKEYMRGGMPNITLDTQRAYVKFENLFNGDKLLSDEMNEVIDANWKDLFKELGGSMGQNMVAVLRSVGNYVFEGVPYDEIFPIE